VWLTGPIAGTCDALTEKRASGPERAESGAEIGWEVLLTHVLDSADAGNAME
jgi:hypothetical protein